MLHSITPHKGGSYWGVSPITGGTVNTLHEEWTYLVGLDWANRMMEYKEARDGGSELHMTVFTPAETRKLSESQLQVIMNTRVSYEPYGVGVVTEGDREAWFILIESQDIQDLRESLGFGFKDLHATIGFEKKDIFSLPKNSNTRVI